MRTARAKTISPIHQLIWQAAFDLIRDGRKPGLIVLTPPGECELSLTMLGTHFQFEIHARKFLGIPFEVDGRFATKAWNGLFSLLDEDEVEAYRRELRRRLVERF